MASHLENGSIIGVTASPLRRRKGHKKPGEEGQNPISSLVPNVLHKSLFSRLLLNSLPQYNMQFRNLLCRFSFMKNQEFNYLIRILWASLEVTTMCVCMCVAVIFIFIFFLRKPCVTQQNMVNFKCILSPMNYLSFVSQDMIEALFSSCSLFCYSSQINEL